MRQILSALALAIVSSVPAWTGEAVGSIQSVDVAGYTMVLSDGETYTLPQEFDISLIGEGMTVALAYDEQSDVKLVTDMEQMD